MLVSFSWQGYLDFSLFTLHFSLQQLTWYRLNYLTTDYLTTSESRVNCSVFVITVQSYDIKIAASNFVPKNNIFGTGVPIPLKMAGGFRLRWCLYEQSVDVFTGKVRVSLRATCAGLCGGLRVWVYGRANMEQFAMSPFMMKGALHCKR